MGAVLTLLIALSVAASASAAATPAPAVAPAETTAPATTPAYSTPIQVPVRGMDMANVRHIFGAPLEKQAAVGKPPITRWVYADYVVYFEYDKVLHTVMKTGLFADSLANGSTGTQQTQTPVASTQVPAAAANVTAPAAPVELLLDVVLNEQPLHQTALFLQMKPGVLYAQVQDIQDWRLILPLRQPYHYDGVDFLPLDSIPGIHYEISGATQSIRITVPPAALNTSVIGGFFNPSGKPTPSSPGAFFNYSLFATHESGVTTANAFTELGLFNRFGVATTSYLGNELNAQARQWVRLQTTFTQDHPDKLATLRVGDAITSGGMTGLDVNFGGIQYGTNFATQPSLVTLPLPSIGGSAAQPSTMQLYVNGALQRTQEIQPGPFIVPTVPVASGPGTITLVVRDLLGQEQVISIPFYASNSLLVQGLDDYSFSFGKQRQKFGAESNDYGPTLASAMFRRGLSDSFTGEVRGDASPGQQTFGAGAFWSPARAGVFNFAVSASHSPLGDGGLAQIGYQDIGTVFNGGINVQVASPHFTQIGYLPGMSAPHSQVAMNFGAFMGDAGSMSLAYVHLNDPVLGETKLATFNYSKPLGQTAFLNLVVFHDLTGQTGNSAFLTFTIPMGTQRSATVGVSHQNGTTGPFAQVQQSLPSGTGFGYRVGAQFGKDGSSQGELDYQNDVGTYDVAAYHANEQTLYQGGISGGLGFLGGDFFASRQITDAFAVVQVPGQAGVDIYAQNEVVAHTDSDGDAVIPRLLAYQDNHIGFDPRNLPLDTDLSNTNMDLVPYYRSGLVVRFDVKTVHGVTFTVKLPDGSFLPAGAEIEAPGQSIPFPVGYDGGAYVTGLTGTSRLKASWSDKSCEFDVTIPADSKDPLPDLGVFTCEVSKP